MLANSGFKLLQSFAVSVLCRNILSCLLAFIWLSLYTAAIKVLVRSTALHASIILVKIVWSWSILSRTLNDDSSLNAPPVLSGKKLDVCDASIVASIHSTPLWTSFLIDVTVLTIVACSWAFFIAKSFQVFCISGQRSASQFHALHGASEMTLHDWLFLSVIYMLLLTLRFISLVGFISPA